MLSGSGRVKLDDEIVELRAWDALRVAPGVMRAFEGGPEGVEFLAFGAPSRSASPAADVDSVAGWWSD